MPNLAERVAEMRCRWRIRWSALGGEIVVDHLPRCGQEHRRHWAEWRAGR